MSQFQNKVKKQMQEQGFTVLKIIKLSDSGYPDLMCFKYGQTIWIECKEKNDTLKPLQKLRIDQLIEQGFESYCLQDGKGKIYPL